MLATLWTFFGIVLADLISGKFMWTLSSLTVRNWGEPLVRLFSLLLLIDMISFTGCGTSIYESNRVHITSETPTEPANSITNFSLRGGGGHLSGEAFLIQPGIGTNEVYVGMLDKDLLAQLGKPAEEYSHTGHCNYVEMHWHSKVRPNGSMEEGNGIFAYLRDEKVFEISFSGKGFYTSDGITLDSSYKELQARYPGPNYRLTPSANHATNFEDLTYVVRKDEGIAFELGVGYKTEERLVDAIYVFAPSGDFQPWGCIADNQSFIKLDDPTKHFE